MFNNQGYVTKEKGYKYLDVINQNESSTLIIILERSFIII